MACKACVKEKYDNILRVHRYWTQRHIKWHIEKHSDDIIMKSFFGGEQYDDILKIINSNCPGCKIWNK